MSHQRIPATADQSSQGPASLPERSSPSLMSMPGLQSLMGNSATLDLIGAQMSVTHTSEGDPLGQEQLAAAVQRSLSDEMACEGGGLSSPDQAAQETTQALMAEPGALGEAVADSPELICAVAAEIGTTPAAVHGDAEQLASEGATEGDDEIESFDDAVDWVVGGVSGVVDSVAGSVADIPVLGGIANAWATGNKLGWEFLGGFAKGAGDMVGGLANMIAHPIDTASGLWTMAEHIPGPNTFKSLHNLYDVATGKKTLSEAMAANPLDSLDEDLEFWKNVGGALWEPFAASIEQGKYAEALGRGTFEILGLVTGGGAAVKGVSKAGTFGKVLSTAEEIASVSNKVDDAVRIADKVDDVASVTGKVEDLTAVTNKVDDVSPVAKKVDEAATDTNKAGDLTKEGDTVDESTAVSDKTDSAAKETDEVPTTGGDLKSGASATPEDYTRIRTKADVPEHYSSDPRFDDLSADPDHAGQVTDKSLKEAMTGLEAEKQGLVKPPIERGPKGIEFYDADGTPYDVKTPPSPAPGAPFKFKPTESGKSILKQIRTKATNKQTGQDEFVQVMLDTSYMTPGDLASLWAYLQKNASPGELERIIELNVKL